MDTRLKEVKQTDLTEGRINQDFLDWLQTKGTSWLLFILIGFCIYLGIVRWRGHKEGVRVEAWKALAEAKLPGSFEEVADKYAGIDAVADLARLAGAGELMRAVQTGQTIGAADTQIPTPLTDADRTSYLDRADRLFAKVVEGDDQSTGRTLVMVQALNGRAAVSESRSNLDEARTWYDKAAKRAEAMYPDLAEQARRRAESTTQQVHATSLPAKADLVRTAAKPEPREPAVIDDWANELLVSPAADD